MRPRTPPDPVTLPTIPAPAGVPSPTRAPAPAAGQPAISFPSRLSVAGSGWPDLLVRSGNAVQVVPTEGMVDYTTRVTNGAGWGKMSLIAAVGDLTGDHRTDVLAKNRRTGVTRVYPGNGAGRRGTRHRADQGVRAGQHVRGRARLQP